MTFHRAFKYEMFKLLHMQSVWILTGFAFLFSVLPTFLGAQYYRTSSLGDTRVPLSEFDAVALANSQLVTFGAIFLASMAVMFASFELKGGAAWATNLAFPNRRINFAAKSAALASFVTAFAVVALPVCFFGTQMILGPVHSVGLGSEGVLRSLAGTVVYLVLISLLAMGLTYIVRSSAGAIGILISMMLVVSTILLTLPQERISKMAEYLPDVASVRMVSAHIPTDSVLGPLTATLVVMAWTAVTVGSGMFRYLRRDLS